MNSRNSKMSSVMTKQEALEMLNNLFPKRSHFGSYMDKEVPCQRVYFETKNAWNTAMKYAFYSEYGRDCAVGLQRSHRCRAPEDTSPCQRGNCVVGKHIDEQTAAQNLHRNIHQHLIQFYLQQIKHKGWRAGVYYVSDVPLKFVIKFWKDKGEPYEKTVCDCKKKCFVNAKQIKDEKSPRKKRKRT